MSSSDFSQLNRLLNRALPVYWAKIQESFIDLPSEFEARAADVFLDIYDRKTKKDSDNLAKRALCFLADLKGASLVGGDELLFTDEEIRALAQQSAQELGLILAGWVGDDWAAYCVGIEYAKRRGVVVEVSDNPAVWAGYVARFTCDKWWRRKLRVVHGRSCERMAGALGLVGSRAGSKNYYASRFTVKRIAEQKKRNSALLSEMIAVNEEGQEYTLKELADLSVSNPVIRRSELMVRMRGFEDLAKKRGDEGQFYTMTAPSRFHQWNKKSRTKNIKYDGSDARAAQSYLTEVWARVRAEFARQSIRPYGFRVAEPHHDGCPHWHLLLFVPPMQSKQAAAIFRRYAEEESPEEITPKNKDVRFSVVRIDPKKGSATGYIAKYISKNIDAFGVDVDLESGGDAKDAARNVQANSSCWGIRQFQQIGGASVSVWRELRRLEEGQEPALEVARFCAAASDWAGYCEAQGGLDIPRKDHFLKLALWHEFDKESGEIIDSLENSYGEKNNGRVFGLLVGGLKHVITRVYRWSVGGESQAVKKQASGRGGQDWGGFPDGLGEDFAAYGEWGGFAEGSADHAPVWV